MESKEILKFCLEKGLLLDEETLNLFSEVNDFDSVKLVIEKIKSYTQEKIITKNILNKNKEQVNQFFFSLPKENQKRLEKLKIKLGLSIEISKQRSDLIIPTHLDLDKFSVLENYKSPNLKEIKITHEENSGNLKIVSMGPAISKKLEVKDFVNHFRNRFSDMRNILQDHSKLKNLVSINKISENRQGISIIGMVYDKRITKNKNI